MTIQTPFKILSIGHNDNKIIAVLSVDGSCEVFKAHFPDQPVVPASCVLQLLKGALEKALKIPVQLVRSDSIKFLALIAPTAGQLTLTIAYQLTANDIRVNANLVASDRPYMRFQGVFTKITT